MEENPIEAPLLFIPVDQAVAREKTQAERPVGVAILAVLHVLGGIGSIVGVAVVFVILFSTDILRLPFPFGLIMIVVAGALAGYGVLSLLLAVGLWKGLTWAWWLEVIVLTLAASSLGSAIIAAISKLPSNAFDGKLVKHAPAVLIAGGILVYLFTTSVLAFFKLTHLNKKSVIYILLALGALAFLAPLWSWVTREAIPRW